MTDILLCFAIGGVLISALIIDLAMLVDWISTKRTNLKQ